jgi:hypothetical protein
MGGGAVAETAADAAVAGLTTAAAGLGAEAVLGLAASGGSKDVSEIFSSFSFSGTGSAFLAVGNSGKDKIAPCRIREIKVMGWKSSLRMSEPLRCACGEVPMGQRLRVESFGCDVATAKAVRTGAFKVGHAAPHLKCPKQTGDSYMKGYLA